MKFTLNIFNSLLVLSVLTTKTESLFTCPSPGKFPNSDPTKYHECHLVGENRFTMFLQNCPQDSCFDGDAGTCNIDYCERKMEGVMLPENPGYFKCPSAGKFPHLNSSRKDAFYKCIEIKGQLFVYEYQCLPAKPCYNHTRQMCQRC